VLFVHAGDRGCGGVPVPDYAVWVEQDDPVGDVRQRLFPVGPLLRLAVETRVVDRHRRPARELGREREVCLGEGRMDLGRDQRQRPERAAASRQRHGDRGAQAELVDDPAQLEVVPDRLVQELRGDRGEELRLT
jgi:hypothetical protein